MAALIIALLLVFALLETALPQPDIAALRRHPRS